jgi:cell division protein FtsB
MSEETANPALPPKRLQIGRWLVLALGGFGIYTWTWGPYGILRQQANEHRIEHMRLENDSLRTLTQDLKSRLKRLENDSVEIALAARKAGLVRPGEVLVRFVDTTSP